MKLLTWMHRKFRQGSTEALKEFPLGQPLLDDHQVYQKQNQGNRLMRQQRDGQARRSFACLEATRMADLEGKTSSEYSDEYFEGFLAIGTLGTETMLSEPETPTFAVSFEKLADGETEVTDTELRLINDELEKVLAADPIEDGWNDSSSRNSHVSNGRISHASTITLRKSLEMPETPGTGTMVCPLQEYLLGSAVELPEKTSGQKKEQRMSLGELFERHKAEEISETKGKRGDQKREHDPNKDGDKSSMKLMKKILKKKSAHPPSRSSSAASRGINAESETKLCKILHIFHKKVHPECLLTSTEKANKSNKVMNNKYKKEGLHNNNADHDEEVDVGGIISENNQMNYNKRPSNNPAAAHHHFIVDDDDDDADDDNDSNDNNRECWIKTDADYLVLEL